MRAFRIAYDGRPYHGFQRQPDVPTVEGTLLEALDALGVADGGPPEGYAAAGRTDAGVSALAQTVAFRSPDWLTPSALNGHLPEDVRAWASAEAPDGFHATHDAADRTYAYHLFLPEDPSDPGQSDGSGSPADDGSTLERAREAVGMLRGEHDFANLTSDETGTVRDLAGSVDRDGEFLIVRMRAGGFPRQFVRRAVSLIAEFARGEATRARIGRVLDPDPLPGPRGVPAAPAAPLVLSEVTYPGLSFTTDPDAAASARAAFRDRRRSAAARARVMESIDQGL